MWAIAITAIVALPWLLIPCVALLPIFLAIRWYYLQTVRDLKRLEGLGGCRCWVRVSVRINNLTCAFTQIESAYYDNVR